MTSIELYNIDEENDFFIFKSYETTILLDFECFNSSSVLLTASQLKLFNGSHNWMLFEKQDINRSRALINSLELNINIDSKILLIEMNDDIYRIHRIQSPSFKRSKILSFDLIGKYHVTTGVLRCDMKSNYKKDLQGIRLSVAIAVRFESNELIF